jgi:glycosyltransferase involved in cell wall biosynthesis
MVSIDSPTKRILLLSAYDAASHQHWRQQLVTMFPHCHWTHLVLPARYFSWRIRGNSLSWAFNHRQKLTDNYDLLIATSVCDLASLRGFVPELARVPTLVYFHENQLAYPDSGKQHPSVEPAMVNLYSALCADQVAFNSEWNRRSFLEGVRALLRRLPDEVPPELVSLLTAKSLVLPVPLADGLFVGSELCSAAQADLAVVRTRRVSVPGGSRRPSLGSDGSPLPQGLPAPLTLHSDDKCAPSQTNGMHQEHDSASGQRGFRLADSSNVDGSGTGRDVGLEGDAADRRSPWMGDASPHGGVYGVSAASPSNPAALNPHNSHSQPAAPKPISIVWNHRHEHDKGPERLLLVIQALIKHNLRFQLHLLGQRFRQRPAAFDQLEQILADYYQAQGIEPGINRFIEERQQYEAILHSADMVLSTADHDFQGLSMLEAAALGCIAIAPAALAYPEYLPAEGLYPVEGLSLGQQADAAAGLIVRHAQYQAQHPGQRTVPQSVLALKATNLASRWQHCLQSLAKS